MSQLKGFPFEPLSGPGVIPLGGEGGGGGSGYPG
jgi:hypothetical protein